MSKEKMKKGSYTTKVTRHFRVSIPKAIRDELNLETGDYVKFEIMKDGNILLSRIDMVPFSYGRKVNKECE